MKEFNINININFLFCLNKNHSYLKFINNFTLLIFLEVFLFGWSMFLVSVSEQTMDHLRWDNSYCNMFKNINKFREKIIYLFDVITLPFFYFTFLVTCFLTFLMFMFGEVSNAKIYYKDCEYNESWKVIWVSRWSNNSISGKLNKIFLFF
jgi:hypothetical protein